MAGMGRHRSFRLALRSRRLQRKEVPRRRTDVVALDHLDVVAERLGEPTLLTAQVLGAATAQPCDGARAHRRTAHEASGELIDDEGLGCVSKAVADRTAANPVTGQEDGDAPTPRAFQE